MKFILLISLVFCFKAKAAAPDWFTDYVKINSGCDKELLCTVGVGQNLLEASREARLETAKFFHTKIKAKSEVFTTSNQKGTNAGLGIFEEWANKRLSEETNEIISGLEVRKQEQVGNLTYVLMAFEKTKMAKFLQEKIQLLDTENSQMLEMGSRFTYPKMMKNFILIESLNDRYALISTRPVNLIVKKEILQNKINKLKTIKMAIVSKGYKLPAKLNHTLLNLLSSLKVVVVSQKANPKYTLCSELLTEEQYFKVEGFKKLNVQFRLELLNSKSQVLGKLSGLSEQVARNANQAIDLAIPDINEALKNNLNQLTNVKLDN